MKKKILSVILTMIMLLGIFGSMSAVAFADDITDEEPTESDVQLSGNITLYLCSTWNNILPHVFIYVDNGTDHDITVGYYTCPSGQGVSLGTFGMTVSDGAGIYYNVECYRNKSSLPNFMCLSRVITESELADMTSYIKNANWWDPVAVNCCFFAATCWNTAGGSFVFPLVCLPWIMRAEILAKGASHSLDLYDADADHVYRQTSSGLKVVSSGSLS